MDQLIIAQWNSQSIRSNQHNFSLFLNDNHIHVALLCETWLRPHMRFQINGYNIVRLDSGNSHNGVAILIHKSLDYRKIDTFYDDSLQNIAVRLRYSNNKELTLITFYSPGNCVPSFSRTKLDNLINSVPGPLLIAGDFNAHHPMWGSSRVDSRGRDVLECINDNNLVLLNDGEFTTIGSNSWQRNALDLSIVSPSLATACSWSVHDDPLGSFHLPVITKISFSINNSFILKDSCNLPQYLNFKLVKWELYKIRVNDLIENYTIDESDPLKSYYDFLELLHLAVQQSIPRGSNIYINRATLNSPNHHKKNRPPLPWWNANCSRVVEESKQAYIKFKYDPTEQNYIAFKRKQAIKKLTLKNERYLSWYKLCEGFNRTTPLTKIWQISKRFNRTYIPCNKDVSSWALGFLKKFTPDTVEALYDISDNSNSVGREYLVELFSFSELKSAVFSRRDTAFGLDGIPYKMLKNLSSKALLILLSIFNLLWNNLIIPPEWKKDCLVPILKPNKERDKVDSYRPIALTSCMAKTFEQLVKQRIEFYIENNNLLPSNQFGFRRGRSARESISHLQLDIYNALRMDENLVAVFFDVIGAFNNVDHRVLIQELQLLHFPGKVIKWVYEFLHEREVYVKVNNQLIGPRFSYRGVCQGGVLSPLIYIIIIHRLNTILGPKVQNLQFADDLVVYTSGPDLNHTIDSLNSSVQQLVNYFKNLNLDISPEKSKVMIFGDCDSAVDIFYNDITLPVVDEIKFLGVIFTSNLTWAKYVDHIIARANKAFNFIKSLSISADPKILLMLYKSLVRSHFEYGFLCFGSDQRLIRKLEVLQNHNLRCITGAMKTTPVNSLQVECNVPPLNIRFEYLKAKYLLKLLSFDRHPLIAKLSFYHRVYNPSNSSKTPFLLHDFSNNISIDQHYQIHKNRYNWACFTGSFNSKFCDMNIYIKHDMRHKEDVFEALSDYTNYKHIYTDGSKVDGSVSMATYIPHIKSGHGAKVPEVLTIFSAEALAILSALEYIKHNNNSISSWLIITDSQSVLLSLKNNKFDISTNYIIHRIKTLFTELATAGFNIKFFWTPSHIGVPGNEDVDNLARIIVNNDGPVQPITIPYTDLSLLIKEKQTRLWYNIWQETLQFKGAWYAEINGVVGRRPWFTCSNVSRSRKYYTIMNRLRFGHGRFNAHLYRMKIIASPVCTDCSLGTEQTLNHIFFECPAHNLERLLFIDKLLLIYKSPADIPRDIKVLLGNCETYEFLYNFVVSTHCI